MADPDYDYEDDDEDEFEDGNMCYGIPMNTFQYEDYNHYFNVGIAFETRESLVGWAKNTTASHGHLLICASSEKNVYQVLTCHLFGYGREKTTDFENLRNVGTVRVGDQQANLWLWSFVYSCNK
ncbi:hypothetical protein ACP275_11G083200 [Erythranthe tilingii]